MSADGQETPIKTATPTVSVSETKEKEDVVVVGDVSSSSGKSGESENNNVIKQDTLASLPNLATARRIYAGGGGGSPINLRRRKMSFPAAVVLSSNNNNNGSNFSVSMDRSTISAVGNTFLVAGGPTGNGGLSSLDLPEAALNR